MKKKVSAQGVRHAVRKQGKTADEERALIVSELLARLQAEILAMKARINK